MSEKLTGQAILEAGLTDWRLLMRELRAHFATGDFATGLAFVNLVGAAAESADHHPDLDLRYGAVRISLTSHDTGGVTRRDVAMAREISTIAAELGLASRPDTVELLELALDTADHGAIQPFWRAILGYADSATVPDEVSDPAGLLPTLWFQSTEPHEAPRQRFHLDIHVPHDVALLRLEAALAAGGTLVSDANAPSFWVLADADGNKACICTWQPKAS
jgi:4a-hydroxytetrahydrobiopterin dehydratase